MRESEFYRLMEKIEQGGAGVLPIPMQCIQPSVEFLEAALKNHDVEDFVPALIYFALFAEEPACRRYCNERLLEVRFD